MATNYVKYFKDSALGQRHVMSRCSLFTFFYLFPHRGNNSFTLRVSVVFLGIWASVAWHAL